jgi:hypothetical protein
VSNDSQISDVLSCECFHVRQALLMIGMQKKRAYRCNSASALNGMLYRSG